MKLLVKDLAKPDRCRKPFYSRLPLVAALSAGLFFTFPMGASSRSPIPQAYAQAPAGIEAPVMAEKKAPSEKEKAAGLVKVLAGEDPKEAFDAALELQKLGGAAVPPLIKAIKNAEKNPEFAKRSLFVFYLMDLKRLDHAQKSQIAEVSAPMIFMFDDKGQMFESKLAERILQRLGDEAIPILRDNLMSAQEIKVLLSIQVLLEMDWTNVQFKNTESIKEAIGWLSEHPAEPIREAVKQILKNIDNAYITCSISDKIGGGYHEKA